jgi:signal transduction histidine kinase
MLSISVARAGSGELLVSSLLQEFMLDIAWMVPLLVVVTLVIGVLVIRSGLKPVRDLSNTAASIGPSNTSMRLTDKGLPSEIGPLVTAFNRALDRLAVGFTVQRQFTANAAHELRTPLAIITAALDAMDGDEDLTKLKVDVARMNRLVEQLLRVARLDAIALDVSETVDLRQIAENVAATMAPLAMTRGRAIAFADCEHPVPIRGNAYAVGDAIRNVVENAIAHSPRDGEISIITHVDGSVEVADHGHGIPADEKPKIFDRFWRGRSAVDQGAGLGLAIVQEIVRAHQGTVEVRDNSGGGTVFVLRFPRVHDSSGQVGEAPLAVAAE